jgi:hypothetical protein
MKERIKDTHQSLLINDVLKERDDLQGLATEHGSIDMPGEDIGAPADKPEADKQSPAEKLVAAVLKDAYVKESMAILVDMAAQHTEIAGKERK